VLALVLSTPMLASVKGDQRDFY